MIAEKVFSPRRIDYNILDERFALSIITWGDNIRRHFFRIGSLFEAITNWYKPVLKARCDADEFLPLNHSEDKLLKLAKLNIMMMAKSVDCIKLSDRVLEIEIKFMVESSRLLSVSSYKDVDEMDKDVTMLKEVLHSYKNQIIVAQKDAESILELVLREEQEVNRLFTELRGAN